MTPSGLLEINSTAGRLLIAVGFFVFVGFGYVALMLLHSAQDQRKRGFSNLSPCGCMAAAFITLLLTAWARGCALR